MASLALALWLSWSQLAHSRRGRKKTLCPSASLAPAALVSQSPRLGGAAAPVRRTLTCSAPVWRSGKRLWLAVGALAVTAAGWQPSHGCRQSCCSGHTRSHRCRPAPPPPQHHCIPSGAPAPLRHGGRQYRHRPAAQVALAPPTRLAPPRQAWTKLAWQDHTTNLFNGVFWSAAGGAVHVRRPSALNHQPYKRPAATLRAQMGRGEMYIHTTYGRTQRRATMYCTTVPVISPTPPRRHGEKSQKGGANGGRGDVPKQRWTHAHTYKQRCLVDPDTLPYRAVSDLP